MSRETKRVVTDQITGKTAIVDFFNVYETLSDWFDMDNSDVVEALKNIEASFAGCEMDWASDYLNIFVEQYVPDFE